MSAKDFEKTFSFEVISCAGELKLEVINHSYIRGVLQKAFRKVSHGFAEKLDKEYRKILEQDIL